MTDKVYDDGYIPKPPPTFKPITYKETESGCWECTSHTGFSKGGYIGIDRGGKKTMMHRYIYQHANGCTIPAGLVVMHKCDNRTCMNPDHLEVGTHLENMQDKVAKGRQTRGEAVRLAKLNATSVRAIRADTRTHKEIAKDYGIGTSQISRVRTRKTWKHVD